MLCFAEKPGACQTGKMLLLFPERKQYECGYKITCLHGKNVEVIGQTMVFCFQKWEGSETSHFQESCRQVSEDLTCYSWWQILLLMYSKKAEEAALLCFSLFHPDGQNSVLVCSEPDIAGVFLVLQTFHWNGLVTINVQWLLLLPLLSTCINDFPFVLLGMWGETNEKLY